MWVVLAFVIAASVGTVVVLAAARHGSPRLAGQPWLLYDTAKLHVGIMGGLNLPRPKKMDVAVPANRACGEVSERLAAS